MYIGSECDGSGFLGKAVAGEMMYEMLLCHVVSEQFHTVPCPSLLIYKVIRMDLCKKKKHQKRESWDHLSLARGRSLQARGRQELDCSLALNFLFVRSPWNTNRILIKPGSSKGQGHINCLQNSSK